MIIINSPLIRSRCLFGTVIVLIVKCSLVFPRFHYIRLFSLNVYFINQHRDKIYLYNLRFQQVDFKIIISVVCL